MAKLSEVAASATHSIVVFGAPKSGKTQLVGDLSVSKKLIWFDLENGYATLLKLPREQQERIELIRIPDTKDFPIAIETLLKVFQGNAVEICEAHGKVACPLCKKDSAPFTRVCLNELESDSVVVVDSLTQLTNSAIANITKNRPEDYKMQFDDWGSLKAIIEKFLSYIQQARYNVVCISHEEEVEQEDGKKRLVPVSGSSKSSRNTAKYFSHCIYCEVKNKKHIAASSTTYATNILSGSRTNATLESDSAPTLLSILDGRVSKEKAEVPSQGMTALQKLQAANLKK